MVAGPPLWGQESLRYGLVSMGWPNVVAPCTLCAAQTAQKANVTVMKKARQIRDAIFYPKSTILPYSFLEAR